MAISGNKDAFKFPMQKSEQVLGIILIPFLFVIMPFLLVYILLLTNADLPMAQQALLQYAVCFVIVLAVMFRFLRASFSDFIGGFWRAVQALILSYVLFRVLLWAAALLLAQFMFESNPNQDALDSIASTDFRISIVIAVLLAPIVEESTFRGALFGTIRKKSRVAAYIVSTLLFCLFHLWDHLVFDFSWATLSALVQYVPASIALAWCYERGGTIWSPIFLHMAINLIGTLEMR